MTYKSKTTILSLMLCLGTFSNGQPKEFMNLFKENDFSQWTKVKGQPVGNGWEISKGVVHRKSLNGDIVTKQKFRDFELLFEWKISEAGNSGIKYRTRGSLGLEYQVLDDEKHRDNKNPTHRAGSLYELVAAPESKPLKPVGQWNKGRIIAKGNQIEHWLNGVKVVQIAWGSDVWEKQFQKSKYRKNSGFGSWEGPILLQDHNDPVWYRNLKVRKL
jgi:hypothetical protein